MGDPLDEDVVVWWLLQWLIQILTPELVIGIVLALLLVVAAGAVLIGVIFLRYRRHPRVRRAILRLRAEHLSSGLQADVVDLRLHLRDELADARRAVASIGAAGELAGDLPDLLERLEQTADRLDQYLRVLERSAEDDAAYRFVAAARRRVADVVVAARDIRRAAIATLDVTTTGEIQTLTRDVEREVAWVQSGVEAMGDLLAPAPPEARRGPSIGGRRERAERPRRR